MSVCERSMCVHVPGIYYFPEIVFLLAIITLGATLWRDGRDFGVGQRISSTCRRIPLCAEKQSPVLFPLSSPPSLSLFPCRPVERQCVSRCHDRALCLGSGRIDFFGKPQFGLRNWPWPRNRIEAGETGSRGISR